MTVFSCMLTIACCCTRVWATLDSNCHQLVLKIITYTVHTAVLFSGNIIRQQLKTQQSGKAFGNIQIDKNFSI